MESNGLMEAGIGCACINHKKCIHSKYWKVMCRSRVSVLPEVEELAVKPSGERPQKRRCFWEYRRARESAAKKRLAGEMRWSLSWSSSTLPSTLYRREGEHATGDFSP